MIDYDAYEGVDFQVADWDWGGSKSETFYLHKPTGIVVHDLETFEDWLKGMLG